MKPHYRVRKVKTSSGATAVQVGRYSGKRFKLSLHVGSSKDSLKIIEFLEMAQEFIRSRSNQLGLNFNPQSEEVLFKKGVSVTKSILLEAYSYLSGIYSEIGFEKLENDILKHFVMIRVLEPASKIKSISLLKKYFGIDYKKTTVFRKLETCVDLKDKVCEIAIKYAKNKLDFDFSLVFYDVTTLYFETHREDSFRKNGFSKDNKINQPQILVGLLVEKTGFPVYWDVFEGNTFEGKTIIPVLSQIIEKYKIKNFTVVADAGMLSAKNIDEIEKHTLNYIVGARIKNLSLKEAEKLTSKLSKQDGKTVRLNGVLYEYSQKRASKDKSDNDKQIQKAEYFFNHPGSIFKRSRFLKTEGKNLKLNEELITKYRFLEGIKGYRTNIQDLPDKLLISRYKDLWRVEKAFRIAKTDLEARPIYHRKEISIKYHILIVFVALAMAKIIEYKEGQSLEKTLDKLKNTWTITLTDKISGNTLNLKMVT
ncbi:MAG: IS1634 family transposase [Patescibacteria group bacterium]